MRISTLFAVDCRLKLLRDLIMYSIRLPGCGSTTAY
jgi:hypothetical protein